MAYKFENLEVWRRSLEYTDRLYEIAETLPKHERYNLTDQIRRAATSIALNIAAQDYFFALLRAPKGPPESVMPSRGDFSGLPFVLFWKPSPVSTSSNVGTTSKTWIHFVVRIAKAKRYSPNSRPFVPLFKETRPFGKTVSSTTTTSHSERRRADQESAVRRPRSAVVIRPPSPRPRRDASIPPTAQRR